MATPGAHRHGKHLCPLMLHVLQVVLLSGFCHGVVAQRGSRSAADDEFPEIIDRQSMSLSFDGIGGLSGGGATSRLLVDYPEPQRSHILDYLFKPNFGAALQILKVEIGGDSLAGCGAESSHMHVADETAVDYRTGYEWWLMVEAKKRNPQIKLYGLPWSFPGWLSDSPAKGPFQYPNRTAQYIVKWLEGARDVYNLTIDYMGIWNERHSDPTYAITLRAAMDKAGFKETLIVAKDGGADICNSMASDKAYADAVDVIGLHYPSDFSNFSLCHSFKKPFWASEESSSYDDANGAACWARVINSHWVLQQMTASIMWNLVGSYYHGTNWYAESLMTAVQPWSGHYWVSPVIWATAHVTQFTRVGWKYLKNGGGSGLLPRGGYYVTWVDPDGADFTVVVVKISHEHAPCIRPALPNFDVSAETLSFELAPSLSSTKQLQVWYSNFEDGPPYELFEKRATITPVAGKFSLVVPVGGYYTLTTLTSGAKGSHDIPAPSPSFPLPYADAFDAYPESSAPRFLADQIGVFEVHPATEERASRGGVVRQMVDRAPIAWQGWGSTGPLTVLGMREWQDVSVSVDVYIPRGAPAEHAAACVAARSDQMWLNAVVLCLQNGTWWMSDTGPQLHGGDGASRDADERGRRRHGDPAAAAAGVVASGRIDGIVNVTGWHSITLTTVGTAANASIDGKALFENMMIFSTDNGFVGLGTNDWYPIEYDNFKVSAAGDNWTPTSPCGAAKVGDALSARNCTTNGLTTGDQEFDLLPTYQLLHIPSKLCAAAVAVEAGAQIRLQECNTTDTRQTFLNNYSNIRNMMSAIHVNELVLSGRNSTSAVSLEKEHVAGYWTEWVYFPNTHQLRNQYTRNNFLGYPRCLAACPRP